MEGDPRILIYPSDSNGEICGKGQFSEKPYLFFFDITRCLRTSAVLGCPTKQVHLDLESCIQFIGLHSSLIAVH